MKLDYKRMIEEIDALVNSDFGQDMEMKLLPESKPYTQKEAQEMAKLIGDVYVISHCFTCEACQGQYLKMAASLNKK